MSVTEITNRRSLASQKNAIFRPNAAQTSKHARCTVSCEEGTHLTSRTTFPSVLSYLSHSPPNIWSELHWLTGVPRGRKELWIRIVSNGEGLAPPQSTVNRLEAPQTVRIGHKVFSSYYYYYCYHHHNHHHHYPCYHICARYLQLYTWNQPCF